MQIGPFRELRMKKTAPHGIKDDNDTRYVELRTKGETRRPELRMKSDTRQLEWMVEAPCLLVRLRDYCKI